MLGTTLKTKIGKIEAIHIVAAAMDAHRKRNDPIAYKAAQEFKEELVKMWRDQIRAKKQCPHCGNEI